MPATPAQEHLEFLPVGHACGSKTTDVAGRHVRFEVLNGFVLVLLYYMHVA